MTNQSPEATLSFAPSTIVQEGHLRHGLALFNSARFFEAHEALEDVWRAASHHNPARRHLQGLVQLEVAFHHQSTGNYVGARSVMKRGVRNLEGAEASFPEMELASLRARLEDWRHYLEQVMNAQEGQAAHTSISGHRPELPQITFRA
jgi:predicted metal-dependent hydrolase